MDLLIDWSMGLLGSTIISAAAYYRRSLSLSGAAAAIVLGTLMVALGSLAWFGTLIAFFISSTLLSKLKHKRKAEAESGYAKSGRRDAGQVAANGGIGLLLCAGNAWWPDPVWWALFLGVMATVTADTWATELGGLSSSPPRSIITRKRVAPGTSGGITLLGLSASAAGGLFIGGSAWVFVQVDSPPYVGVSFAPAWMSQLGQLDPYLIMLLPLLGIGLISGLAGSLCDSWLGAALQVMYRCGKCGKEIERPVHCEVRTAKIRGISWMTNDAVNAVSSLTGGGIALLLALLLYLAG